LELIGMRLNEVVLENESLRVVALPQAGAKIFQITYKPLGVDILWNNPGRPPSIQGIGASYDDNWCGGWDELFPNDEPAEMAGQAYPDHGEFWTGRWDVERFESNGSAGVRLSFSTPISRFYAQKEVLLHRDRAVIEVRYRLSNQGSEPFPFLFKLHPAFAVSTQHRIDLPPVKLVREPEFPGTLIGAPAESSWPKVATDAGTVDISQIPDVSSRALYFLYGTGFSEGWCGITDTSKRLAAGLRYDASVFPSCWLFASYGGWRDLNVAVLEPATGYPFTMQSMIREGRARTLAPGETLATTVLFSVREGVESIGRIREDGKIVSKEEA
jgi:hypothetical protein